MPNKPDLIKISKAYQQKQLANIQRTIDEIMQLMEKGASKAAYLAAKRKLINNRFLPVDVRNAIERIITVFHDDASKVIINGIARARKIAEEKNALIAKGYLGGGNKPPTTSTQILGSSRGGRRGGGRKPPVPPRNTVADSFENRFTPRSLSPRVWKLSNSYKATLKKTLVEGLREGTGAKVLAKSLRRNLRHAEGAESPGQGVYKSPRKNAERLARTEINMAYENEDFKRWQQLWFVVGIEIRLSAAHPKFDQCDFLTGLYPKDFMFPGWHPQCLCIAVPVMAPQDIRDQMLDYDLGLIDEKPEVKYITDIPDNAKNWISTNAKRIKGWKNTPYFMAMNEKYTASLMEN